MLSKLYWKVKIKFMSNQELGRSHRLLLEFNKDKTKKGAMVISLINREFGKRMTDDEYCFYRASYLDSGKNPDLSSDFNKKLYENLKSKKLI